MTQKQIFIKEKAIIFFNRQGFLNSSMRSIAKECKMTLSNLQYYFKNKENLLLSIFEDMSLVFEGKIVITDTMPSTLQLLSLRELWIEFQKRYLFFFNEISSILQQYPKVQKKYERIKQKRVSELVAQFNLFAQNGIFREDLKDNLHHQAEITWFILNYFLSTKIVSEKKIYDSDFDRLAELLVGFIFPLLTPKGVLQFTLNN